jgi:hypothetical protein
MPVERKHGTRAKYVGDKCRCDECRRANREYAKTRSVRAIEAAAAIPKGKQRKTVTKHMPWSGQTVKFRKVVCAGVEGKPCPRRTVLKRNSTGGVCSDCRERLAKIQIPTVSEVKKHLAFLSKNGIGTRAVQKAARVSYATLRDIKNGIAKRVTVEVESRILAVTTKDFADGALVPSDEAWELIGKLRKMGMPKVAIARKLGNKGGGLQINKKRVIHRTLQDLRLIYEQALKDKEREELLNSPQEGQAGTSPEDLAPRGLRNHGGLSVPLPEGVLRNRILLHQGIPDAPQRLEGHRRQEALERPVRGVSLGLS